MPSPSGEHTDGLRFVRALSADDSALLLYAVLARLRSVVPTVSEVRVSVSTDLSNLIIQCPVTDCRIVEFQSGRQTGTSALKRGTSVAMALDVEIRVEPVISTGAERP
jgi:hypothetical protein